MSLRAYRWMDPWYLKGFYFANKSSAFAACQNHRNIHIKVIFQPACSQTYTTIRSLWTGNVCIMIVYYMTMERMKLAVSHFHFLKLSPLSQHALAISCQSVIEKYQCLDYTWNSQWEKLGIILKQRVRNNGSKTFMLLNY